MARRRSRSPRCAAVGRDEVPLELPAPRRVGTFLVAFVAPAQLRGKEDDVARVAIRQRVGVVERVRIVAVDLDRDQVGEAAVSRRASSQLPTCRTWPSYGGCPGGRRRGTATGSAR
jgi:hypothetical protein